jgi:hypothetical protein
MRLVFLAITTLALVACGGGEMGPSPLSHHLGEEFIARVPLDQRPQQTQSQNDYALAKSEKLAAQDKVNEAETDVKLAKGELDQALIAEKNAKVKLDSANGSGDQTRINAAEHESRAALLERRQADAKLAYMKAKLAFHKKWLRYTDFDVYAKEAKFELEKAKVAKANNINPKGFAYDPFEQQYKQRSEAAQKARAQADNEKGKMLDKEKAWKAAEKEWNDFKGVATPPAGGTGTPPTPPAPTPDAPK